MENYKIMSTLISTFGGITNTLSLSYFLLHEREGVTNRLFILLSFWDFLTCLNFTVFIWADDEDLKPLYAVVLFNTCFAIMLIAITRAIKICTPFYDIKGRHLGVAATVFFLYSVIAKVVLFYNKKERQTDKQAAEGWGNVSLFEQTFWSVVYLVMILISNVKCVMKLLRPGEVPVAPTNAEAAKTVLIISALFTLFNSMLVLFLVRNVKYVITGSRTETLFKDWDSERGRFFFRFFFMLSSVFNPIVYFSRNQNIRTWVRGIPKSIRSFRFFKSTVQPANNMPRYRLSAVDYQQSFSTSNASIA